MAEADMVEAAWVRRTTAHVGCMATENEPVAPTRVDALIDCWLSGQIPEADMIARLREDELLRRRFERRLGRQLTL